MAEERDKDLIQTALRESHEEVGLIIDCVDVWGPAQAVPSRVSFYNIFFKDYFTDTLYPVLIYYG